MRALLAALAALYLFCSASPVGGAVLYRSDDARPSWTAKLPSSDAYFSFVGLSSGDETLAAARQKALENASMQVMSQAGVEISGTYSSLEQETDKMNTYHISGQVDAKSKGAIQEMQVEDSYYEESQSPAGKRTYDYWILVQVPKAALNEEVVHLKKEASDSEVRYQALMKTARQSEASGEVRRACEQAVKALIMVKSAFGTSSLVQEAGAYLKTLFSEVTLTPQNDNQVGSVQKGLPQPLSVSVAYGEKGLKVDEWPVKFGFVAGDGRLNNQAFSDPKGQAACTVSAFGTGGKSIHLTAQTDDSILLAGLPDQDPTRQDLMAVIAQKAVTFEVSAYSEERGQPCQMVVTGLWPQMAVADVRTALIQNGFKLEPETLQNDDYYLQDLDGDVDYVVFLRNELPQVDEMDGLTVAVCKASIEVQKRDGKVIALSTFNYSCTAKGGGANRRAAMEKAVGNAADLIVKYVDGSSF